MPASFDKCADEGGRVRTVRVGKNKYMRVCYKDGKSFSGEVKEKKTRED